MGEKITITSYDGHAINDGTTYSAYFLAEDEPLSTFDSAIVQTEVAGDFPDYVRSQPGGKVYPLKVKVIGASLANIRTLKYWMTPYADEVYLKGTDTASVTWRLKVKCLQLVPWQKMDGIFIARLYAPTPIWEQDTEQTDTQAAKTTSPISYNTAAVAGSARTYPTFTITPTASKDHANGYKRRWRVVIANKVSRTLMDTLGAGYPIDIVNNTLDTATETTDNLLASGADLRVFVDGRNLSGHVGEDRWLQDMDNATTQIWCNITFAPAKTATPKTAPTNVSPVNGESIIVGNAGGLADWPESGFFVIDDEVIYYASRTDTSFDEITRAVWGTVAAAHDITDICYWVEHDIQIEFDYTAAASPPSSDDLKPVISLASTNAKHTYPGPFTDPDSRRSGQFLPTYKEINETAPYISLNDTGTAVGFLDTAPVAGKPQRNNLELYTPCGVDTAAASLEQDVTVPANMLLRAYGADTEGYESLLAEWNPDTDGANEQLTPAGVLPRIRYAGLIRTVTAAEPTCAENASGYDEPGDTNNKTAQQLTLDQSTTLYGMSLRLHRNAAADGNIIAHITQTTNADLDVCSYIVFNATFCAVASLVDSTTDYTTITYLFPTPLSLPAGSDYFIVLERSGAAGAVHWGQGSTTYPKGSFWKENAGTWTEYPGNDFWFRLLGDGSVNQDEVPVDTDAEAILDNIEITFDLPPYVAVIAKEEIYSYDAVLENTTTGQAITIHFISALNEALTINCETKTVTGGELGLSVPYAIDCTDEVDWLYLVPGVNALKYTEASIGTLGIVAAWRGRWS